MNVRLTNHALAAINRALAIARRLGHDHVGCEHILLGILDIADSACSKRLVKLGFALVDLAETMRQMIGGEGAGVMQRGPLPMTPRTTKVLEMAQLEAGDGNAVGTLNLLVAMLREGENAAAQMLFNAGLTLEKFLAAETQPDAAADDAKKSGDGDGDDDGNDGEGDGDKAERGENGKAQKTPTVNAFGRDLTELARTGALDPVIGRERELRRIIQVLGRRTKNNAVLIGEAGVGKTAVVEGLAQAIHLGRVPERMQRKRVIALDMARVVAGTQYRGQFEERLKRIVDETKRAGNIILFLDEIHTLVGAGGAEGAMDAANILKPALARGELQCVGATTLKEYHKSIEKDAALERRFQSIQVEEPTVADSIAILKGIAPKYSAHHAVSFTDDALAAAVELTARYLPARQLPDKAIDAMDETGSRLRTAASARPKELVERQEELDSLRAKKDEAVETNDFDNAVRYREEMREKSAAFAEALKSWRETHAEETIEASVADVAETVSIMSGVPVERMNTATAGQLLALESTLGAEVIGQDVAIGAIARALRRSRALLSDPKRPIGSFLFLGPTGVGKTHLAKMLAEKIYGDDKALIRLDMSEYQEKYAGSRLVGAPPGYVGYDEGGQLTEKVRRRPYSVVLFDEFEKADGDVMNMLLQILDEGRLTDGQGRVVDFRNTLIICTANLGFDFAREGRTLGFATESAATSYEVLSERLRAEAKRTFRPELLNRFDETVVFRKLEKADLRRILDIEIAALQRRLEGAHISLSLDEAAAGFLVDKGYDSSLGARPLRRIVQEFVEDPLAELVLAGKTHPRMKARLDPGGKALRF